MRKFERYLRIVAGWTSSSSALRCVSLFAFNLSAKPKLHFSEWYSFRRQSPKAIEQIAAMRNKPQNKCLWSTIDKKGFEEWKNNQRLGSGFVVAYVKSNKNEDVILNNIFVIRKILTIRVGSHFCNKRSYEYFDISKLFLNFNNKHYIITNIVSFLNHSFYGMHVLYNFNLKYLLPNRSFFQPFDNYM